MNLSLTLRRMFLSSSAMRYFLYASPTCAADWHAKVNFMSVSNFVCLVCEKQC